MPLGEHGTQPGTTSAAHRMCQAGVDDSKPESVVRLLGGDESEEASAHHGVNLTESRMSSIVSMLFTKHVVLQNTWTWAMRVRWASRTAT